MSGLQNRRKNSYKNSYTNTDKHRQFWHLG
nr:MAG TPA: hypothetical protein [Caudoviricetes sp.]